MKCFHSKYRNNKKFLIRIDNASAALYYIDNRTCFVNKDVYKRQEKRDACRQDGQQAKEQETLLQKALQEANVQSVSYTHLDVYKRQARKRYFRRCRR